MSSHEQGLHCPHGVEAAPYVLGALDDDELRRYVAHLSSCVACLAQVAELQPVADELALGAPPAAASDELRRRILTTVRSEAKLLRAAGHEADVAPGSVSRRRARRFSPLAAGVVAAFAVAVAVAIAIGVGSSSSERVTTARIAASAAGARAALHQSGGRAELVVSGMPQPARARIYEVWLSRGPGDAQPTNALFGVTSRGNGAVAVPDSLHGVKEVMVTSEPLGGSSQPTSAPLIRVVLST